MRWVYPQNDSIQNAGSGKRPQVGTVGGQHTCCKKVDDELRKMLTEKQLRGGYRIRHHMHSTHSVNYA